MVSVFLAHSKRAANTRIRLKRQIATLGGRCLVHSLDLALVVRTLDARAASTSSRLCRVDEVEVGTH